MDQPKDQTMKNNGMVDEIIKERERIIQQQTESEHQAKERHRESVERAARVAKMVKESPGYTDLYTFMVKLKEEMHLAPEDMMKPCAYDKDMNPIAYDVDQVKVGQVSGARQALDSVLLWVSAQEQIIDREAKKQT